MADSTITFNYTCIVKIHLLYKILLNVSNFETTSFVTSKQFHELLRALQLPRHLSFATKFTADVQLTK